MARSSAMNQPGAFDRTVEQSNIWINEVIEEMGRPEKQRGYHALRAVLHVLRDRLTVDEAANLSAQLPMLLRGLYYDGYKPSRTPLQIRERQEFLDEVAKRYELDGDDPEVLCRAVFHVLDRHITGGERDEVRQMLPREIRSLWT